jgi:FkbM family methyltransferase
MRNLASRWQDRFRTTVASVLPLSCMRALALVERLAGELQGKGIGTLSIDAEVRAVFSKVAGEALTVFDVGANKGHWSTAALRRAGGRIRRIIAFEPSLAHTGDLFGIPDSRVQVERLAFSDQQGTAMLYAEVAGSGLASLARRRLEGLGIVQHQIESVVTTTVDTYARVHGYDHIDVLKLDIEGYEFYALRGAAEMLQRKNISVIMFEFGGTNLDTRVFFRDFWDLLTGHGFTIGRILMDGRIVTLSKYSERLESFSTTNYVAWLSSPEEGAASSGGE